MNTLFPPDVYAKIVSLGYFPTSFVPLYHLWSIVGIKDEKHFNIQLSKKDLEVVSTHFLKYRWNATGTKILEVKRIPAV